MKKTNNKNTELAIEIIKNYGFRVEELYSLNHNNVDFKNNIIKLKTKGRADRKINIKPNTADMLKEFINTKEMGGRIRNIKVKEDIKEHLKSLREYLKKE